MAMMRAFTGLLPARSTWPANRRSFGIEGEVRVSELHGWDQSPPSGGAFPFRVSGNGNIEGQRFELFAEPKSAAAPLRLHLVAGPAPLQMACAFDFRTDGLPIFRHPRFAAQLRRKASG